MPPKPKNAFLAEDDSEEDDYGGMEFGKSADDVRDFVSKLEPAVQRRVHGLHALQGECDEVSTAFLADMDLLEKKYAGLFAPLFEQRSKVLKGEEEPTSDDVAKGRAYFEKSLEKDKRGGEAKDTEEGKDEGKDEGKEEVTAEDDKDVAGVPKFWLTVLQNHTSTADMVQSQDEEALGYLVDIRCDLASPASTGFAIHFHFLPNPFFSNAVLSKKYTLVPQMEDLMIDNLEGTEIDWKADKNLTVKEKKVTQRNKNTKETRTTTKVSTVPSFFAFFKNVAGPDTDDLDEDEIDELEVMLESDYEKAVAIKESVIPKAVLWFTGAQSIDEDLELGEDDGDEEEEDDDDDDDDEDAKVAKAIRKNKGAGAGNAAQPQECKQQ